MCIFYVNNIFIYRVSYRVHYLSMLLYNILPGGGPSFWILAVVNILCSALSYCCSSSSSRCAGQNKVSFVCAVRPTYAWIAIVIGNVFEMLSQWIWYICTSVDLLSNFKITSIFCGIISNFIPVTVIVTERLGVIRLVACNESKTYLVHTLHGNNVVRRELPGEIGEWQIYCLAT